MHFIFSSNAELMAYASTRRGRTYICKPEMGCQGRGIFLVRNVKDLNPFGKMICQVYVQRVKNITIAQFLFIVQAERHKSAILLCYLY